MTIWAALDAWGRALDPWQRYILAISTQSGRLSDEQVRTAYELFAKHFHLTDAEPQEVPIAITGRPDPVQSVPVRLERVDGLSGINALPQGAALTFGPHLTVIYGRNGSGKSGFAKLFANACFSRQRPSILPNVYDKAPQPEPAATFHIGIGGQAQEPIQFSIDTENPELKRISLFDTAVAKSRVSDTAAFEFKPIGFDVFPEMARVYREIDNLLDNEVSKRNHVTDFSRSFIGIETDVSKLAKNIDGSTNLDPIRSLAIYGPTEKARLIEIKAQLQTLRGQWPKNTITVLKQARSDVEGLGQKFDVIRGFFTADAAAERTAVSVRALESSRAAALLGSDQFKRPFFSAVGTAAWEGFAKSVHTLARLEGEAYPSAEDRCLLCEHPLDEAGKTHIQALLSYVESDVQKEADSAVATLRSKITQLRQLDLNLFSPDSRVFEHVHRLHPALETEVREMMVSLATLRELAVCELEERRPSTGFIDVGQIQAQLRKLIDQITADITRLETEEPTTAIASLELERQTLRHREVLKQLLPDIESQAIHSAWCTKAATAKGSLNTRHITEQEKDLFREIIGDSYRAQLAEECRILDCTFPIELQTVGQRGQTIRSLAIRGGHRPDAILSEGEQKAIALADFLTEVSLNPGSAGIVLDDPVTSQDHERKDRIASRLVAEARQRQVVVFTHDLPFLNQLVSYAEDAKIDVETHWIDRDHQGRPGVITLGDAPATSRKYDTTQRAREWLSEAKQLTGSQRDDAIRKGMAALRRTVEETVAKRLFKGVIGRWNDRVIVTSLKKVRWENALADELGEVYEALSAYIEGHSHTDEAMGAPPELRELREKIDIVDGLIHRARPDR